MVSIVYISSPKQPPENRLISNLFSKPLAEGAPLFLSERWISDTQDTCETVIVLHSLHLYLWATHFLSSHQVSGSPELLGNAAFLSLATALPPEGLLGLPLCSCPAPPKPSLCPRDSPGQRNVLKHRD